VLDIALYFHIRYTFRSISNKASRRYTMATLFTAGFSMSFPAKMRMAATTALAALALVLMPAPQAEAATKKQAKSAQKTSAKSTRATKVAKASKVSKAKPSKAKAATKMQRVVVMKNGKRVVMMRRVPVVAVVPPRPSYGQLAGLHGTHDALDLKSSVAYVLDQDTNEILFQKNENAILPIASLTKLMTGVVVSEARLDMNELITIVDADVDTEKGSRSRLKVGSQLTRGELMLLSLMSSENRAAHALGRSYPGGMDRFVQAMNAKAKLLGMQDTRYVEPTGLSSRNQSSAKDLATLTAHAYNDKTLRELSTAPDHQIFVGEKPLNYVNTNRLVRNPDWEIGLQKTGFISEAGQCLIMQAKVSGRRLIMVFLDSAGKLSRLGDAERVRRWVEGVPMQKVGAKRAESAKG
jgi:serine-type D-Ala-D-Ala endopeptidase (penicillin-binding protein 7)